MNMLYRHHRGSIAYTLLGLLLVGFLLMRPSVDLVPTEEPGYTLQGSLATSDDGRLPGVDVSHYQGRVKWRLVEKAGMRFAYLKSTQGMHYVDPRYQRNARVLKRIGLPFGPYHFFVPGVDPIDQARHFLRTVEIGDGSLPPVLDIEVAHDLEPGEIQAAVSDWLQHVEAETGCRPMIYTNRSFWIQYLDPKDGNAALKRYPIWLAQYAARPKLPSGIDRWNLWQHTESGRVSGIDTGVNMSWFAGNPADLAAFTCGKGGSA